MQTLAVIDYGMGNLHSVAKAVEHVASGDTKVVVTADPKTILDADRVIFPGVGAMRDCMGELKRLELDTVVKQCAKEKPLLGICVGMQSMLEASDENGGIDCLGLFKGNVRRFKSGMLGEDGEPLKIPHMGWNEVLQLTPHPLWQDIKDGSRFYFVHSYYAELAGPEHVAAATNYGGPFTSVLARDNVFAVQFHPEKSQHAGLRLLENFVTWNGKV